MMKQLSLFAQNNKGTLQDITGILKNEQINILGSVTNDSAEYGIIRKQYQRGLRLPFL